MDAQRKLEDSVEKQASAEEAEANLHVEEVLDAEQAATLLNFSRAATIRSLAARGELPCRKIAGEWRFSRRALLGWLAGHDIDRGRGAQPPAEARPTQPP